MKASKAACLRVCCASARTAQRDWRPYRIERLRASLPSRVLLLLAAGNAVPRQTLDISVNDIHDLVLLTDRP